MGEPFPELVNFYYNDVPLYNDETGGAMGGSDFAEFVENFTTIKLYDEDGVEEGEFRAQIFNPRGYMIAPNNKVKLDVRGLNEPDVRFEVTIWPATGFAKVQRWDKQDDGSWQAWR